jgi:hypothetical protein
MITAKEGARERGITDGRGGLLTPTNAGFLAA